MSLTAYRVFMSLGIGTIRFGIPIMPDPGDIQDSILSGSSGIGNEHPVYHSKCRGRVFPLNELRYNGYTIVEHRSLSGSMNDGHGYCNYTVEQRLMRDSFDACEVHTYMDGSALYLRTHQDFTTPVWNPGPITYITTSYESHNGTDWRITGTGSGTHRTIEVNLDPNYPKVNTDLLMRSIEHDVAPGFVSELLRDAASSMYLSSNNIANAQEVLDIAKDAATLILGGPKKIVGKAANSLRSICGRSLPKLAGDSWLKYRYLYNTTKSDALDFVEKYSTVVNNDTTYHVIRSGGSTGNTVTHVKVILQDKKQNAVAEMHRKLRTVGLAVTPYNVWDMIPFSFIVDWFLPIGKILENQDAEFFLHSAYYDIVSVTISHKTSVRKQSEYYSLDFTRYNRSVDDHVSTLSWYEENPSKRTVIYRALDAASLLIS